LTCPMGATEPGPTGRSDPMARVLRSVNRVVRPIVKAGLGSPLPVGLGAVVLGATGRVSGEPREVPLLGLRVGDRVFVSTVRERSQWLRNVEANPRTAVWYCGRRHETAARVQRGPLNVVTLEPVGGDSRD